jgi:asparagine synthase (glutamine-hydrolysing)
MYDHTSHTFWKDIEQLPAGSYATYSAQNLKIERWYHITEAITQIDYRSESDVIDELLYLLESSITYRFRADVPVGICLSGGLDSSLLLALVNRVKGKDFPLHAFTFYTADERYDELPWVQQMIENTSVIHHPCLLTALEIPQLAKFITSRMDEPFGGIPTMGMSKVFETARQKGITVLLDGNGMDEAWGGYDYYQKANTLDANKGPVQGATSISPLSKYLKNEIRDDASVLSSTQMKKERDAITNLQLRDLLQAKIPRAMRFADRNSMSYSLELREPFLDYRMVELGLRQPSKHKIQNGQGKYLVRKLAEKIIPKKVSEAPKRPLQTPQREWIAHELKPWVEQLLQEQAPVLSHWFEPNDLIKIYEDYCSQKPDNSFYIWQLVNAVLLLSGVG